MGKRTRLTTGQIRELIDIDRSRGGIGEEAQELIARLTSDRVDDIIWVGEVEVDYGVRPTYAELNGTWFDWANEGFSDTTPELRQIEANPLPTSGIRKHRFGYVYLGRNATNERVLMKIAKCRVIPADDLEAMYFRKAFPEEQRKFPIVALRSFFRFGSYCFSAVLCESGKGCDLNLSFSTAVCPWYGGSRFLVREDGE